MSYELADNECHVEVCVDCYFAHHYGVTAHDRKATVEEAADWLSVYGDQTRLVRTYVCEHDGLYVRDFFAGENDHALDVPPLNRLTMGNLYDATDSETGEGIDAFSWAVCDGCNTYLGGERFRLLYEF